MTAVFMIDAKIVQTVLMICVNNVMLDSICMFPKEDVIRNVLKDFMVIIAQVNARLAWIIVCSVLMFLCVMYVKAGIILQDRLVLIKLLFNMALYQICQGLPAISHKLQQQYT